jgi:hypothetical protein
LYIVLHTHVKLKRFGHTSCDKPGADFLQDCSNKPISSCVRTACSRLVDNLLNLLRTCRKRFTTANCCEVPLLASCVQSCFHDICRIQNSDFSLKTLASANASLFKFKRGTRFSHIALAMVLVSFLLALHLTSFLRN